MFCSTCGKQAAKGAAFCDACGTPLENTSPAGAQDNQTGQAGQTSAAQPAGTQANQTDAAQPYQPVVQAHLQALPPYGSVPATITAERYQGRKLLLRGGIVLLAISLLSLSSYVEFFVYLSNGAHFRDYLTYLQYGEYGAATDSFPILLVISFLISLLPLACAMSALVLHNKQKAGKVCLMLVLACALFLFLTLISHILFMILGYYSEGSPRYYFSFFTLYPGLDPEMSHLMYFSVIDNFFSRFYYFFYSYLGSSAWFLYFSLCLTPFAAIFWGSVKNLREPHTIKVAAPARMAAALHTTGVPGSYPQGSVPQGTYPQAHPGDAPSFGYAFLGFIIRLVGLILFIVWKDQYPQRSLSAGKGALVSVILSMVTAVVGFIVLMVLASSLGMRF